MTVCTSASAHERFSYWVCEKSDGVRVLLLVQTDNETQEQAVYIVRAAVLEVCSLADYPMLSHRLTATTRTER